MGNYGLIVHRDYPLGFGPELGYTHARSLLGQ